MAEGKSRPERGPRGESREKIFQHQKAKAQPKEKAAPRGGLRDELGVKRQRVTLPALRHEVQALTFFGVPYLSTVPHKGAI